MANNIPYKVSVVTITFNSSKFVKQAIESVLSQSYSNFEYIISDDCSTDNTWEIIQEYKDPRIRAWRNERNIGEYPNRNKTLFEAKGDYILWIDGDDILYPHGLAHFMYAAEMFINSAMIMARPYCPFIIYPYELSPEQIYKFDFLGSPVTINGFPDTLFKTKVLKEFGGLPEKYISGDTFIKRKIAAKYNATLIAQAVSWWRLTPGQASQKLKNEINGIVENVIYNKILLNSEDCPLSFDERELAHINMYGSFLRKIFKEFILRFRFRICFKIFKQIKLNPWYIKAFFIKGKYNYTDNASPEDPLCQGS